MATSVEDALNFLHSELKQFSTRTVALEFIVRALMQRTNLSQADVLAIMEPHVKDLRPDEIARINEAVRQFFQPLDGLQRAQ